VRLQIKGKISIHETNDSANADAHQVKILSGYLPIGIPSAVANDDFQN
jgi:hypothetical protein